MDFHFYLHFHCHLLDSDIFIKEWESENISIFPSVTTWYFVNWIDRGYFSKERLTNGFFLRRTSIWLPTEVLPEAKLEWLNYGTLIILSKTFILTNLTFLLKLNVIDTHQSTDKIWKVTVPSPFSVVTISTIWDAIIFCKNSKRKVIRATYQPFYY